MSGPAPVSDPAPRTVVCLVELSGRPFAIEISQAREARVFGDYTVVPLGPPHLTGMANLRGAIIPIVDPRVLLGLPTPGGTGPSLVVEVNTTRVALAVDRVHGVESLDGPLDPGEDVADAAWLQPRRLRRGDEAVPVLDVAKIVASLT